MTTYQLLRQLVKLDPDGTKEVMLSVRTIKPAGNGNNEEYDATGILEGFSLETDPDVAASWIVLEAVDA